MIFRVSVTAALSHESLEMEKVLGESRGYAT